MLIQSGDYVNHVPSSPICFLSVVGEGDRAYVYVSFSLFRFWALASIILTQHLASYDQETHYSYSVVLMLCVMPSLPDWEFIENLRPLPRNLYIMEYPMPNRHRAPINRISLPLAKHHCLMRYFILVSHYVLEPSGNHQKSCLRFP